MVENRATKNYKYFIENCISYSILFNNNLNVLDILRLPYPLYIDIMLRQIEEKKKEKKAFDEKMNELEAKRKRAEAKMKLASKRSRAR